MKEEMTREQIQDLVSETEVFLGKYLMGIQKLNEQGFIVESYKGRIKLIRHLSETYENGEFTFTKALSAQGLAELSKVL